MIYDIIVVGAGIAGLTAAIYGRRANKSVLVLEASVYGGQIINTPDIENYPGEEHISGADLMKKVYQQAVKLGAEFEFEKVINIERRGEFLEISTEDDKYEAYSVIIASGTKNRHLGLAREDELIGHGISFCATCDGALYKGKTVAVYGGGYSALSEASYLAGICDKVYLIHRRNELRAEGPVVEKFKSRENSTLLLGETVAELRGDKKLTGIILGDGRELELDALFVAIGREAAVDFIDIEKDENGYIVADENCRTNIDGIFAAGDIRAKAVRQLVTASSDGAIAANSAIDFLNKI